MRWCDTEVNDMVWDGGSDPLLVQKSLALLGVVLGWEQLWMCVEGVGFIERSVGTRLHVTYK